MENHITASDRARWISLLAKAPADILSQAGKQYGELPHYGWLRRPEIGLAMVRARAGGTGGQFNLGEMSVTRCALRLHSGPTGIAYVAGRDMRRGLRCADANAGLRESAADGAASDRTRPR